MKRKCTLCISVTMFVVVGFFTAPAHPQAVQSSDELHVLFIGNSFTYYHDLPKMISELAKAGKQRPLHYERETPGGCTLEKHWKDGKALAKIQSRKWDFVVLQDHSTAALLKKDSLFNHGRKFDAEIKKRGSKTILYMTWALQNTPGDQPAISKAYLDLSKELKVQIAPVGNAWDAALMADKKLVLHEKDKKHPNATGTYLAACVFYATIYGESPEGLPGSIGKLTDDEARPLQVIAWKAIRKE
jgi:hypothetical protein